MQHTTEEIGIAENTWKVETCVVNSVNIFEAIHGQGTIAKEFFLALFADDNQGTFGALFPLSVLRGAPLFTPVFLYDVQCRFERSINHVNSQPVVLAIVKLYHPECVFGCTNARETAMR